MKLICRENDTQLTVCLINFPNEGIREKFLHCETKIFLGQEGEDGFLLQLGHILIEHQKSHQMPNLLQTGHNGVLFGKFTDE